MPLTSLDHCAIRTLKLRIAQWSRLVNGIAASPRAPGARRSRDPSHRKPRLRQAPPRPSPPNFWPSCKQKPAQRSAAGLRRRLRLPEKQWECMWSNAKLEKRGLLSASLFGRLKLSAVLGA